MADNLPPADMGCHLTGFEKSCRSLVTRSKNCCKRWMQIQGSHPNTGEQINRWDCVDNWLPVLQLETAQQARQTGAAVESFRNESVMQNAAVMRAAMLTERIALSQHEPTRLLEPLQHSRTDPPEQTPLLEDGRQPCHSD